MADLIRLYLDEDAQRTALVRALRARQIDVLTANEAKSTGASDSDQLVYATALGRTVFTFNRGDFVRLHVEYLKRGQGHSDHRFRPTGDRSRHSTASSSP